jgi:hypothetical protein
VNGTEQITGLTEPYAIDIAGPCFDLIYKSTKLLSFTFDPIRSVSIPTTTTITTQQNPLVLALQRHRSRMRCLSATSIA